MTEVYFAKPGEKGLNMTSAAHMCAVASQIKNADEKALENVSFVNTTVSIIGNGAEPMTTEIGITESDLNQLHDRLDRIAKMNSFIAWFAEARTAHIEYANKRTKMTLSEWANEVGKELPVEPKMPETISIESITEGTIKSEFTIKEMNEYLALQAKSSTYGKFIHPDRPMEVARDRMHSVVTSPFVVNGTGRDMTTMHSTPSLDTKLVDTLFNKLQREYRETEQHLNKIKSEILHKMTARRLEAEKKNEVLMFKYKHDLELYHQELDILHQEYAAWVEKENERVSKIKLAIPNDLAEVVDYLNNLDK